MLSHMLLQLGDRHGLIVAQGALKRWQWRVHRPHVLSERPQLVHTVAACLAFELHRIGMYGFVTMVVSEAGGGEVALVAFVANWTAHDSDVALGVGLDGQGRCTVDWWSTVDRRETVHVQVGL